MDKYRLAPDALAAFNDINRLGMVVQDSFAGQNLSHEAIATTVVAILLRMKPGQALIADPIFTEKDIETRVRHKKFGVGIVRSIEHSKVNVMFLIDGEVKPVMDDELSTDD